jgi:hypothetical protein
LVILKINSILIINHNVFYWSLKKRDLANNTSTSMKRLSVIQCDYWLANIDCFGDKVVTVSKPSTPAVKLSDSSGQWVRWWTRPQQNTLSALLVFGLQLLLVLLQFSQVFGQTVRTDRLWRVTCGQEWTEYGTVSVEPLHNSYICSNI